jgi:hypothetical protein
MPNNSERIARLEAELAELKAKGAPRPSSTPSKPPAWAQQSTHVGMAYCGPPSVPQRAESGGPVGIAIDAKTGHRKFPDGLVRDQFGEVVPHSSIIKAPEDKPVLPSRSVAHEMAIQILDDGLRDQ